MNAINNHDAIIKMLSTLDPKNHIFWDDKIEHIDSGELLGYHVTWWNKKENITLHFYYGADGEEEKN